MFFPEKIISIKQGDRVLEVGPGASPYPRSNAFLELAFENDDDKLAQRGGGAKDADFGDRPIYSYDGNEFPFEDDQFDYVICSHVIEHVLHPENFLNELFRVGGGKGYIEYPLITYEYLYDFDVHMNFVKYDCEMRVLRYLSKSETTLHNFSPVSSLFYKMLESGWDDLCSSNKALFFEGVEFDRPFAVKEEKSIEAFLPPDILVKPKSNIRRAFDAFFNRIQL